jgi:hypothetical protein
MKIVKNPVHKHKLQLINSNADWNATSGDAQILNKPTIPAAQIQSDWNQANSGLADFIKNKPTIPANAYAYSWFLM